MSATGPSASDDARLLGELRAAMRAVEDVPRRFVDVGKAVYTWRSIDAELAAIAYDSAVDAARDHADDAAVRGPASAEVASLRRLTFVASRLTIELEITGDALFGQLVPPAHGDVDLHVSTGEVTGAVADEVGWFTFRIVPSVAFRLHCRTGDGGNVITAWVIP